MSVCGAHDRLNSAALTQNILIRKYIRKWSFLSGYISFSNAKPYSVQQLEVICGINHFTVVPHIELTVAGNMGALLSVSGVKQYFFYVSLTVHHSIDLFQLPT